jgi:DNA polymerase-3 subunit delta
MHYLLSGDDSVALRFRKQELIKEFLQAQPDGQVLTLDFTDGRSDSLVNLKEELLPTLFAAPKTLVVDGIGALYERAKEQIEDIFSLTTSASIIFLEQRKILKTDAFIKFAKKHAEEENFDLKKRDLNKFISILQENNGVQLDTMTLNLIKERSGKDDELALQNIQKVLTYTQGEKISKADLDALVPAPLETKVFDALDALVNGKKDQAFSTFHRILTEEDIFRVLPLCAWQIRQMLLVTDTVELVGENKERIAKEAGMHPFVAQKLLRVLPNFSRTRLARGLRILADLDVDLKLSRKTPEGALQYFVFHW